MPQPGQFIDAFMKTQPDSANNSDTILGVSDSGSPASPSDGSKHSVHHLPSINVSGQDQQHADLEHLLTNSRDIKKQLSQSFQGGAGAGGSGSGISRSGISKPHSRRNSTVIKSAGPSDNDNDEGEDKLGEGNERKRRDNINEKIQELLTLIPPEFFQDGSKEGTTPGGSFTKEGSEGAGGDDKLNNENEEGKTAGTKDGKPNKGQILTKSVEYLQYLQNLIDENNRKEVELAIKLRTLELKKTNQSPDVPIRIGHTSAEKALGEIGVGPCSEEYFRNVLITSANAAKSSRKNNAN